MTSGVVFDLFHTLVDPEPLYPRGFDKRGAIADAAGVDREPLVAFWAATYEERETTPIDLVDLIDRHCASVGRPLEQPTRTVIDELLGVAVDEAVLSPDSAIVDLVAEVSTDRPVGVLSNCHEREVRHWNKSPLCKHVQVFGRSSRIGAMKPDPAAYAWIVERLAIDPAASVYVGNGGSDELVGARAAGFATVIHMNAYDNGGLLVPPAEQLRRATQADLSVNTTAELRAALSR